MGQLVWEQEVVSAGSRYGLVVDVFKDGAKPTDSQQCEDFVEQLIDYKYLWKFSLEALQK